MKNLVADMEQKTAEYNINPNNFRVDVYISLDKTVIIIAKKDNNYTEWLSIGKLSSTDNNVGQCINYLLRHSPLPTSTFSTWKSYEEFTKLKYEDLFVFYQHVGIKKENDSHFLMNGERIARDASDEYIQRRLIQYYEVHKKTCIAADDLSIVRESIQNAITEIRTMEQECPFSWALNKVSDQADKMFEVLKNKYDFYQDEETRKLLHELYRLKSSIYNKYMTAVR